MKKGKKYHTVRTVRKTNRKIAKTEEESTSLDDTYIYKDRSLSCLGTCTSIKIGVLGANPSFLSEMRCVFNANIHIYNNWMNSVVVKTTLSPNLKLYHTMFNLQTNQGHISSNESRWH